MTLWERTADGLRELDPVQPNGGFTELRPTTLVASDGRECQLLVDDEPLSQVETGRNEWEWQPGFYAGEVRVELLDRNDLTLGTWLLDVSPDAGKAGRDLFERMINEIVDFDARLVVGEEPARRRLGALGETDDPLVWLERLRRRRSELNQALAAIRREPVSVLKARRRLVPLRDVRRTDLRTLQAALRRPAALAAIRPGVRSRLPAGSADAAVLDVPSMDRTLDAPANRCALAMLQALLLRCRDLTRRLDGLSDRRSTQEASTDVVGRAPRWRQIVGGMEREFVVAERRPPFSEVRGAEVTAAGLNAVAAHPLYGRFWRVGWEALRRGVYRLDTKDLLPLTPTWEIYERWCFTALARKLREWLPDYAWNNVGAPGSDRRRVVGRRGENRVTVYLQKTFSRTDGIPKNEAWSVSRECRPDLVLTSETGDGGTQFVVLDAKYRTGERNILKGIAESVHLYHDAIRWGPRRPDRALLLVPNSDEAKWLTREDYVDKHHVGVIALRPDIATPEWFRHLMTAHATVGPAPCENGLSRRTIM